MTRLFLFFIYSFWEIQVYNNNAISSKMPFHIMWFYFFVLIQTSSMQNTTVCGGTKYNYFIITKLFIKSLLKWYRPHSDLKFTCSYNLFAIHCPEHLAQCEKNINKRKKKNKTSASIERNFFKSAIKILCLS